MPPVGIQRTCENGAERALIIASPPIGTAGKNLRYVRPSASAVSTSVAVATPGMIGSCAFEA
eukprot:scaffold264445_cov28-Tisochrysis_lutea.AAC.3